MAPAFFYNLAIDDQSGWLAAVFGLGVFAFSAWMAIDCWHNGRESYWIWLIFITGGFGAVIYFLTQYTSMARASKPRSGNAPPRAAASAK